MYLTGPVFGTGKFVAPVRCIVKQFWKNSQCIAPRSRFAHHNPKIFHSYWKSCLNVSTGTRKVAGWKNWHKVSWRCPFEEERGDFQLDLIPSTCKSTGHEASTIFEQHVEKGFGQPLPTLPSPKTTVLRCKPLTRYDSKKILWGLGESSKNIIT
jgi:hypothetical protein